MAFSIPSPRGFTRSPRPSRRGMPVAQEGDKVAGRREAQTHHHRILRRVEQLVDVVRVEPALEADLLRVRDAGKGHHGAVGKGPLAVRDEFTRVVLMDAPCQCCPGVVGADRLVGWGLGHILRTRRGAENVLDRTRPLISRPSRCLATGSVIWMPGRDVAFPPAIHASVYPSRSRKPSPRLVALPPMFKLRDAPDVSAVHDVIQERPVAAAHVDGL